jgi:hypothetical protein
MSLAIEVIRKAATDERNLLLQDSEWRNAFLGAEPKEPLLVWGKDGAEDYFIVQFRQGNRTTAILLIDPQTGEVDAVTGIQKTGESMYLFLQPEEVPAALQRYKARRSSDDFRPIEREDLPRLPADIRPETISVVELYWEACDQSLTPFQPLYRVEQPRSDGSGKDTFYVRVDGELFPAITHAGMGM